MKAMILAAGYGKRMRPLTSHTPKPLLKVNGKPLIVYHLERLAAAGFNDVIINLGWLGDQLKQALGDGSSWALNIQYSREQDEPLETGGGIYQALPLLSDNDEPFLVINGDIFTDFPLSKITLSEDDKAHLVLVDNPDFKTTGDFSLSQGRVQETGDTSLTFSGVSVLSPALFDNCKPGAFPLAPLLVDAMGQSRVSGQYYNGYWTDVGTPARLQLLESDLRNQATGNQELQDQSKNS